MRAMTTVLIVMALALSACGRKGDLKPPPVPGAAVEESAKKRGLF